MRTLSPMTSNGRFGVPSVLFSHPILNSIDAVSAGTGKKGISISLSAMRPLDGICDDGAWGTYLRMQDLAENSAWALISNMPNLIYDIPKCHLQKKLSQHMH